MSVDSPLPPAAAAPRSSLDALRGLAAGGVVLHHLHAAGLFAMPVWLSLVLSRGVELFFALSGFLILRSVLLPAQFAAGTFAWHRMRRILPVYLICLAAVVLVSDATPLLTVSGLTDIGAHLFLVHGFFADFVTSLNPPAWSLSHEWLFYGLLLALAAVLRKGRAGVLTVSVAMLATAFCCRLAVQREALDFGLPLFHPLCRLDGFVFGMLGAWCSLRPAASGTRRNAGAVALAGLVLTIAALAWYGAFASRQNVEGLTADAAGQRIIDTWNHRKTGLLWYPTALSLAAGVLVTGLAALSVSGVVERTVRRSPLVWLGKVSYSTYLWHMPVILTLLAARARLSRAQPDATTWLDHPVAAPALCLGLIYGLSAVSWHLLEKPFLRLSVPRWLGSGKGINS